MPRNNSRPEPEMMTWWKAAPALALAILFDALRIMFEMFWFFGPILIGSGTAAALGDNFLGKSAGVVSGALAGYFATPVIAVFGVIMAMATGLAGWLAVGIWLLATNARIFKVNITATLWVLGGFALSELPFLGSFPALTGVTWRLYHMQIKKEKEKHKKWKSEAAAARDQQQEQATATVQIRIQREAENDARYAQEERNETVPEEDRLAA